MSHLSFVTDFTAYGGFLMQVLFGVACLGGCLGFVNVISPKPLWLNRAQFLLLTVNILFFIGFIGICLLHYQIYLNLPLALPEELVPWVNRKLSQINAASTYGLPLYSQADPPRYAIPLWIDNEKYYFWFMCYALYALKTWKETSWHRYRGMVMLFLAVQVAVLFLATNPFVKPLHKFFTEISQWYSPDLPVMSRFGVFMQLYPKMHFYYNASYMWLHPPMLFLSYVCISMTFISSLFMLFTRESSIEIIGYNAAKFGYVMLTLGMLLGYPWALKAWGPNWWWDPKICSSIMMWAIYSTYLHSRIYVKRPSMWYFTAFLGILCFLAMLFTFISSFYFPGEHTF